MGDFTARCAISGIPLWNRNVVAIGLTVAYDNTLRAGAITVTDMYKIATLPIYGQHDGYGFIDEIHNPHSERVSCAGWSEDPKATFESLFRDHGEINSVDFFGKPDGYKMSYALVDAQVWFWLLENSEGKKAKLLEAYTTNFLPRLAKMKEEHAELVAELTKASMESGKEIRMPQLSNDVRWAYRNGDWRVRDSFANFMRAIDSFEVLADPFGRTAMAAFINQDMEVVEGLIELYCVTMALRDIDKFWQPSSTCGDQYGEITTMKVKFAEFNVKNFKAMRKDQKRSENE